MAKAAAKKGNKPQNRPTAIKPTSPDIQEETSSHEEELNRRIVPSQPKGGEPEELAEQGIKPGDVVQITNDEVDDDALATLSQYKALYPNEEAFCLTSDGQVFLNANHRDADLHEKTLTGKKAKRYKID